MIKAAAKLDRPLWPFLLVILAPLVTVPITGGIATHPSDPNLVLASSIFGQLFYSGDGGGSWQKIRQEFP